MGLFAGVSDSMPLEERIRERDRRIDAASRRRVVLSTKTVVKTVSKTLSVDTAITDAINHRTIARQPWSTPSVSQALGVPAIQRGIGLISSTTGMLSILGYVNGVAMDGMEARPSTPAVVARPDPWSTPYAFYGGTAADLAKYGEFIWWIASLDGDGHAAALVRVPVTELRVQRNPANRLLPKYVWQGIDGTLRTGTRYSGANPTGRFVHVMDPLAEPFALRGEGPLQRCGAAVSVTVEAQNWAANFYAEGGHPATVIKKAGFLSPEKLDPLTLLPSDTGLSEADILRGQVIGRANNTAMVIDDGIESITYQAPTTVGAQMLDARQHQNGDAARMLGIPGSLLEYQQPGSSLTYQNLEGEFTRFIRVCLQPSYLEPIEQAMSDLLTRSTTARFNVKGFLRADIKTRAEVYNLLVPLGVMTKEQAAAEEGYEPGDVEFAPVPFAPPAAVPMQLSNVRDVRCPKCTRLVTRSSGVVEGFCRHCKHSFTAGQVEESRALSSGATHEVHVHLPEHMVTVEAPITIHPADVVIHPPEIRVEAPVPGPMTINLEQPATERQIAAVAAIGDGFARFQEIATTEREAWQDQIDELRSQHAELVTEIGKPRKRTVVPQRDADGRIVAAQIVDAA